MHATPNNASTAPKMTDWTADANDALRLSLGTPLLVPIAHSDPFQYLHR